MKNVKVLVTFNNKLGDYRQQEWTIAEDKFYIWKSGVFDILEMMGYARSWFTEGKEEFRSQDGTVVTFESEIQEY